jgi:uncharacterized protein (TIGR04255 family)
MGEHLASAPLVEIIAELRWNPRLEGAMSTGPNMPMVFPSSPAGLDDFLTRFSAGVPSTYSDTERLFPAGFPLLVHQPAYRLRQKTATQTASLYQIGAGYFSANAVPPYQSWEEFRNVIRDGIVSLLNSRSQQEVDEPFATISLRYVDAFGPNLTEGRSLSKFVREVLNFDINLPRGLTQHLLVGEEPKPYLQIQIPMQKGMTMTFSAGEGIANNKHAIITDTTIATTVEVIASVDAVMEIFEEAHRRVSLTFRAMTDPIRHLMSMKEAQE